MKEILLNLFEHKTLTAAEAKKVMLEIGSGVYNDHEIAAFITVYLMRRITIEELEGFRAALLELAVKINFEGIPTMDIVGTGGDGKNTFNISTLACFIVAGAGHKVAKHGNYGASSVSGASNVMEQLGYRFNSDADTLKKELEVANICFLHAPFFHPALKNVGPIRRNLRVNTFFNMLGPIVNPANPAYRILGVYNLEMARIYNYVLQKTGDAYTIVHGLDGYDEISLTGETKLITNAGEKVLSPEELGEHVVQPDEISGGSSVKEAAKIFQDIISGKGSPAQNAVVQANAAVALQATGAYIDYNSAYAAAKESLMGGKALQSLNKLIGLQ
ncbi:MAG: anthranilate phosphoribosyltransferase [Ferruginibacter sp.]|nr:anthranilate phosphoribosyltransferase [Ferruginibacter sp.]